MDRLDEGTRALSRRAVYAMSDDILTGPVGRIQVWTGRLAALQAAVVGELDGRGAVKAAGSVNASAWLRDRARVSIPPPTRSPRLARSSTPGPRRRPP